MKAAVCYEYDKPLVIEDIDIAAPGPGEVKVKVAATAVCHSDIHVIKGELPFGVPCVAGHETAGWVEEVGPGVDHLKPGDPVVASLLISCGKCKPCLSGMPHACAATWERNTKSPYKNKKGQDLTQVFLIGSFAEKTIVHHSQCVKLPKEMPLDRASLLACGFITGFGAVVWRAKVELGSSVVVIGTGGVGLSAIQGAAISGAYPIIAVDVNDAKLEASKIFGASHTVNSAKEDPIEAVKRITNGEMANYAFGTVGVMKAMAQGVDMIGTRGWCVWVGLPGMEDTMPLAPMAIVKPEKVITGGYMGSCNLQLDIPKLVNLYLDGRLKLDEMITHRFKLEQINEAIDEVVQGKALRNIIMLD